MKWGFSTFRERKKRTKKQVINFRFAASISLSLSTPVPILWRMRLQEYQCVGIVSLFLIFLSRVGAWSFIFWNDHHQWQTIAEEFQTPYSFMISSSFFRQTSPTHGPAWIGPPGNMKKIPRNRSWEFLRKFWEHCKQFLGTKIYLPGSQQLKGNNSQELFMEPNFFTWHKTQVSAMFPRTFPGIETASSWDLCPACHGSGGG